MDENSSPTFKQVWDASYERYNSLPRIASVTQFEMTAPDDDDIFDVRTLKGTKYEEYAWGFHGITKGEAERRQKQLDQDIKNIEILDAAPWWKELPAMLGASLTDPVSWVAGGAGRATSVATGAGLALLAPMLPFAVPALLSTGIGLAAGAVAAGAAEWAMQNKIREKTSLVDGEQTFTEMLVNTGIGIGLNYGLGKTAGFVGGKLLKGADYIKAKAAQDAKYINKRLKNQEPTLKDLKAQYFSESEIFTFGQSKAEDLLSRFTHGFLGKMSPHNRVIMRAGNELQRALTEVKVMDRNTALNKVGVPSQVALEAKIVRGKSEAFADFEDAFATGLKESGYKTHKEFNEALYRAYLTPDGKHENAAVEKTAKRLLDNFGNKKQKELVELGVLGAETPALESSYLPIRYDRSKILKADDTLHEDFTTFMRSYFQRSRAESRAKKQSLKTAIQATEDIETKKQLRSEYRELATRARITDDEIESLTYRVSTEIATGDRLNGAIPLTITNQKGRTYKKPRVIMVPQKELMPFTDTDFYSVYKKYIHSTVTDVELAKLYGPSMKFVGSDSYNRIIAERDRLAVRFGKNAPWIHKQYNESIRDIDGIITRLSGKKIGAYATNPDGWFDFSLRVQRGVTAVAVLGMSWTSSVAEMATTMMAGAAEVGIKSLHPGAWSSKFKKLAKHELMAMRLGIDDSWSTLQGKGFNELIDDYRQSPIKAKVIRAIDAAGKIQNYLPSAFDKLRTRMLTSVIRTKLGFICDKASRGKIKKKDAVFGHALGLSDDEMKNVGELISKHGKVKNGYYGIDQWEDRQLADKVIDALNIFLIKRSTAVRSVDLPFLYDHGLIKSVLQFNSWMAAYANKILIPGIWDHRSDLAMTTTGLLALSYAKAKISRVVKGEDIDTDENMLKIANDTGLGVWWSEGLTRASNIYSGLATNNYKQVARSLGPGAGQLQDTAIAVSSIINGNALPGNDLTDREFNAWRTFIPFHNFIGVSQLFKPRYSKPHVVKKKAKKKKKAKRR